MLSTLHSFATTYSSSYSSSTSGTLDGGVAAGLIIFYFIILIAGYVLTSLSLQAMFKKAGRQDAWAGWVPIYNFIVLLEIVGRPVWWLALMLIPVVSFVVMIMIMIDLAKSFGQGGGMIALLILLTVVGYLVLGFGSAQYVGPAGPEGRSYGGPQPPMPPQPPVAAV